MKNDPIWSFFSNSIMFIWSNPNSKIAHTSKFENEYIGPFKIIKHSDDALNFKIKSLNDKNEQGVQCYNRLRKYHANKPANELTGPTLEKRGRPRMKSHVGRDEDNLKKRTPRNQTTYENTIQRRVRPRDHKNYRLKKSVHWLIQIDQLLFKVGRM